MYWDITEKSEQELSPCLRTSCHLKRISPKHLLTICPQTISNPQYLIRGVSSPPCNRALPNFETGFSPVPPDTFTGGSEAQRVFGRKAHIHSYCEMKTVTWRVIYPTVLTRHSGQDDPSRPRLFLRSLCKISSTLSLEAMAHHFMLFLCSRSWLPWGCELPGHRASG